MEGTTVTNSTRLFFAIKSYILISQQAELDKAIDFLDPIDTDVPKGGKGPQLEDPSIFFLVSKRMAKI